MKAVGQDADSDAVTKFDPQELVLLGLFFLRIFTEYNEGTPMSPQCEVTRLTHLVTAHS